MIPTLRHRWSMTAQLISLQVLAVSVLMGGALVAVYYSIAAHLEADNRDFLSNQLAVLSRWVTDSESRAPLGPPATDERNSLLSTLPQIYVRLVQAGGTVQLESQTPDPPPLSVFPAPGAEPAAWRSRNHQRFLLASARIESAHETRGLLLQLALNVSDEDTLLRHLRQRIAWVFAFTLVVSGILTLFIARGVFRPLAKLTAAAAQVQASQLSARIDGPAWPVELTRLAREFDAMLARLDESFRRLARFSSDLSHELRTPINNLRGEAEVALSRARPPEEYCRVLESSLEEYGRLGQLIDTLLFIAKADNPEHGIRRKELDGAVECRAVAEFFEAMASERQLQIQVHGTARVYSDAGLLRRALANLVDNAARHTPAGGRIEFSLREDAQGGEIEVRDTGTGIPAEHLPRVFERFYRSEPGPGETPATTGFGLGLAIVKSIMDLHGGTVNITSQPGAGTTVRLHFPGPAKDDRNVI